MDGCSAYRRRRACSPGVVGDGRLRSTSGPVATTVAGIIEIEVPLYCKLVYEVPRIGLVE